MEKVSTSNLCDELLLVGCLSELQVKHIAVQIIQAMAILHHCNIAHRDIKLSNIGFRKKQSNQSRASSPLVSLTCPGSQKRNTQTLYTIKCLDFGMAGFTEDDGLLRGRCGTVGYAAPEILYSGPREGYSINCDMFSVSPWVVFSISYYYYYYDHLFYRISDYFYLLLYDRNRLVLFYTLRCLALSRLLEMTKSK